MASRAGHAGRAARRAARRDHLRAGAPARRALDRRWCAQPAAPRRRRRQASAEGRGRACSVQGGGLREPAAREGPLPLPLLSRALPPAESGSGGGAREAPGPRQLARALAMGAGARGLASAARSSQPSGRVVEQPIWFAMVAGQQEGPLGAGELARRVRGGAIGPRTYVWKEGMPAWQRCVEVPELAGLFGSRPPIASPPRPAAPPAPGEPARAAPQRAREGSPPAVEPSQGAPRGLLG